MKLNKEEEKKYRVDILKDIAVFCEENNISYYLAFGTLLGAAREKGMIKWDYDIDIMMPRPDYARFLSLYPLYGNSRYRVRDNSIDKKFLNRIAIVEDLQTINCTDRNMDVDNTLKRINIEVYPIDGASNIFLRYKVDITKTKIYEIILKCKNARFDNERSIYKNIAIYSIKSIFHFLGEQSILDKISNISLQHKFESSEYCAIVCVGKVGDKTYNNTSIFKEYSYLEYEGEKYRVPKDYDIWLKRKYGNYMFPPQEHEIEKAKKLKYFYDYETL